MSKENPIKYAWKIEINENDEYFDKIAKNHNKTMQKKITFIKLYE